MAKKIGAPGSSKVPPMEKGKSSRKFARDQAKGPGGKVNHEKPKRS